MGGRFLGFCAMRVSRICEFLVSRFVGCFYLSLVSFCLAGFVGSGVLMGMFIGK